MAIRHDWSEASGGCPPEQGVVPKQKQANSPPGLGNIGLEWVGCSPQCEGGEERGHAFYVIRCRISRELGSQIACVGRKKRLELAISRTVLEWVVWRMHC